MSNQQKRLLSLTNVNRLRLPALFLSPPSFVSYARCPLVFVHQSCLCPFPASRVFELRHVSCLAIPLRRGYERRAYIAWMHLMDTCIMAQVICVFVSHSIFSVCSIACCMCISALAKGTAESMERDDGAL